MKGVQRGRPSGFTFEVRGKEVVISHHGVEAAVLRGERAHQFMRDTQTGDPQRLMARIAASFRRNG